MRAFAILFVALSVGCETVERREIASAGSLPALSFDAAAAMRFAALASGRLADPRLRSAEGYSRIYGHEPMLTPKQLLPLGERLRPYRSFAA